MTRLEIVCEWPLNEIDRLTDSDVAENFANNLADPDLTAFSDLTELIRGLGADLSQAKADDSHFLKWEALRIALESFQNKFPNFPSSSFVKFRIFTILAEMLAQTACPLGFAAIDENQFELRELSGVPPISWFACQNNRLFEDSVAMFSYTDFTVLQNEITSSTLSPPFILHFLGALKGLSEPKSGHHYVLVKKTIPPINDSAVSAFSRIAILSSSMAVHVPYDYNVPVSVVNRDVFEAGEAYQQWNDILYVLSEYNSRKEILLKYLTIYHVFENLMVKFPIVELERQNNGRLFSLRDFRRLYERVDENEFTALRNFFIAVLQEETTPGNSFAAHVVARWRNIPISLRGDLETALASIGIVKGGNVLRHSAFRSGSDCAGLFSQMVYKTRCAIVHNKETEFHLTYANLDAGFKTLLEFLMPSLEEICFYLIGKRNNKVWYASQQLLLYQ